MTYYLMQQVLELLLLEVGVGVVHQLLVVVVELLVLLEVVEVVEHLLEVEHLV